MAISCGHCGGRHDTPAEVRACSSTEDGASDGACEGSSGDGPDGGHVRRQHSEHDESPTAPVGARVGTRRPPAGRPAAGRARASAGPNRLGRHAVVTPGATPPAPWNAAEVVLIDAETVRSPSGAITRLLAAHQERRRVVIEWRVDDDAADPPAPTVSSPLHELGPTFSFESETLHHLVWSNSVDLRVPDQPRWSGLDLAVEMGASPSTGPGDVVRPDGTPVWLDGGPLAVHEPIDGVPVVSLVAVEHGSFVEPVADAGRVGATAEALASDQLAAVTHGEGAARIIAPAGSGKTRVLTERARHLVQRWRLPPSSVTLVAFNKRAQEEMADRTRDLPGLQVRTLNSIALAIINGSRPLLPQPRRWTTIDEPEVRRVLGDLVKFPRRRNSDPVAPWIEALGLVRLGLLEPAEVEARYGGDVEGFASVWPAYAAALERRGLVDFDDQIHRALRLLLSDVETRRAAQRTCRVMLVDEFQDLTPAHLLLIRLLAAPGGAVFGVGDDDQTIYGYNGARPDWLIDFAGLFPGAGAHPLEVNYRCPAGVVTVVDRLLRHNERRVAKTIRAASDDPGGWAVDDRVDPVGGTVHAASEALRGGAAPADVAVLTRVNALLAPVQVALATTGTPVSGGVGTEFVERTSVRAALAWLRLACSIPTEDLAARPFVDVDIHEALRRPSRSMHPRIGDWVAEQRSVVDLFRLVERLNNERDAQRVGEFAADVQRLQRLVADGATTSDLLFALVDEVGLGGSVQSLDDSRRGMNRSAQRDDLTAVQQLAALHDDPHTFGSWLRDQLAVNRSPGGVVLATVHRVKGQEWPHVIVHQADADQFPHRLADDVEEERRLFHVAVTRASRHVTIVSTAHPSPFVAELTSEPSADRTVRPHAGRVTGGRAAPRRPSAATSSDDLDEAGRRRFEALRELRGELRDGKPAYVVFDNKTLVGIARRAPETLTELSRVPGVGPAKLERYGQAVLDRLRAVSAPS